MGVYYTREIEKENKSIERIFYVKDTDNKYS